MMLRAIYQRTALGLLKQAIMLTLMDHRRELTLVQSSNSTTQRGLHPPEDISQEIAGAF
jgi:hypothetical protein